MMNQAFHGTMGFDLDVSPSNSRLVSLEQRPSQSSVGDPDEVQAFGEEGQ